jgi:hypothetical protein
MADRFPAHASVTDFCSRAGAQVSLVAQTSFGVMSRGSSQNREKGRLPATPEQAANCSLADACRGIISFKFAIYILAISHDGCLLGRGKGCQRNDRKNLEISQ